LKRIRRHRRSFAPILRATNTFALKDSPTKNPTNKFTSAVVEPTAATAWSDAKIPSTATSAALKSICKTFIPTIGNANNMSFFNSGPLVISICLDFTITLLLTTHFRFLIIPLLQ
jgi:hypothetical protein